MVSSSLIPIIRAKTYLTDGDRLYYVLKVNGSIVKLENCSTLMSHTRNLDSISQWTEVNY